jgi:hypothetical protein
MRTGKDILDDFIEDWLNDLRDHPEKDLKTAQKS